MVQISTSSISLKCSFITTESVLVSFNGTQEFHAWPLYCPENLQRAKGNNVNIHTKWNKDSNDTLACFCDFLLFQFRSPDRFILVFHQRGCKINCKYSVTLYKAVENKLSVLCHSLKLKQAQQNLPEYGTFFGLKISPVEAEKTPFFFKVFSQ